MVFAHASAQLPARVEAWAYPTRRAVLGRAASALVGGAALAVAGCRGRTSAALPAPDLAALAERYTRLTLHLARHQPSLVEIWLGPPSWNEGRREPVHVLKTNTLALVAEVSQIGPLAAPDNARLTYLRGQAAALDAAADRLLGESQPFVDEAQRSLGHAPPTRDATALDALRRDLSAALPSGPGTLAERHSAFRHAHSVPTDRVETVFAAAVTWCRNAAGTLLPLPAGETLTTRAADETGWAAFSRPAGPLASELWVSQRGGADAAQMLQLAAHEGTPGHHAQHTLATAELVNARGWWERALTPAFGPHRLLAEGAAEAGADLLLPLATRERLCAELLLPAAGQAPAAAARLVRVERLAASLGEEVAHIARDYLDSSQSMEAMTTRLRDEALVLDPAGMLSFIEKQRTKVLAYPLGRRLVEEALGRVTADERWRRFAAIATTLTLGE
jgi:hypothetical protein